MKIKTFKDLQGREWNIEVTAGNLLKACRSTGLSLADITSMEIKLEHIISAIPHFCSKQLKERGLSADDLLDNLGMEQMQSIMTSFFPAVNDAFPSEEDTVIEGNKGGEAEEAPLSPTPATIS